MTYGIKLIAGFRIFKSIPAARQMAGYLFLDALDGHFTEIGFATACNTLYNKEALFCISSHQHFSIESFVGVLIVFLIVFCWCPFCWCTNNFANAIFYAMLHI
jgi:hypothetical protein